MAVVSVTNLIAWHLTLLPRCYQTVWGRRLAIFWLPALDWAFRDTDCVCVRVSESWEVFLTCWTGCLLWLFWMLCILKGICEAGLYRGDSLAGRPTLPLSALTAAVQPDILDNYRPNKMPSQACLPNAGPWKLCVGMPINKQCVYLSHFLPVSLALSFSPSVWIPLFLSGVQACLRPLCCQRIPQPLVFSLFQFYYTFSHKTK